MSTRLFGFIGILVAVALLAVTFETADAARFGGGRSFGGKPSMSKPFTKPVPSAPSSTMRQQTSPQGATAGAAAAAPGRGMFGGMGGMLGGLLAGSLLGSLLFGGGFGGGAGFMDLLLIAGLLYLAFKLYGRFRARSATAGHGAATDPYQPDTSARDTTTAYQSTPTPTAGRGGMDWGALTSKPMGGASAGLSGAQGATGTFETPRVPANFDQEDFLQGAKAAYARLNAAWDKRDLGDIAQFATPSFMSELEEQRALDSEPTTTEIMLVNASLVEVDVIGDEQMASVYFNVLLREDPSQGAPADVREVWHFVRPASGNGSWKLDGIQQVE